MSYYVAIHGGAGFHSVEDEKQVKAALRRACTRALKLLRSGSSACLAVENSISELEDSECLNAGYGSNLTSEGTVECDAAIMDGLGNFGSVGALAGIKNPICAAKAVLDHSRVRDVTGRVAPLTLVSMGALDFARTRTATMNPDMMISSRAQKEWEEWSEKTRCYPAHRRHDEGKTRMLDTVGAVSLDTSGNWAAGVSSGGILLKLPGRIGEAATFGAGCWANAGAGAGFACSASGTGEAIIRASLARKLGDALSTSPEDPHEEIERILMNDIIRGEMQHQRPSVGVIILTKDEDSSLPRLWCAFNTASMAIAYASSHDLTPNSMILRRDVSSASSSLDGSNTLYLTVLPWTRE